MTASASVETCISEESLRSSGHNQGMTQNPCDLHKNPDTSDTSLLIASSSNNLAEEDPLAHPESINIVQQSDTTFLDDEEPNINNSNTSFSQPMHIRNLWGTFEEMTDMNEEQLLLSRDDYGDQKHDQTSPISIDQYSSPEKPSSGKPNAAYPFHLKIDMPRFEMCSGLRLDLPASVIDRCSLYSVIHGINKEVTEMSSNDTNCHVDELKDEGSALVQAVNGPSKSTIKPSDPQVELAVLDEEKFLLAVIASRSELETMNRDCPLTFAEAIGESDAMTISSDDGIGSAHSENSLSVVSAMRTQLWKPSRSWWEAKSGKNPWIEPSLHNKRWRFLWPLIHYHKFLAKCIKKLKRNQVDVKTSLSPVSAFLRQEVCAVSDHLASLSKFGSDTWMDNLPLFQGWTNADTNPEHEQMLGDIIKMLPLKKLSESKEDVESQHFRNIISSSFSKTMHKNMEQLHSVGDNYQHGDKKYVPGPGANQRRLVGVGRGSGSHRPPRGNKPPSRKQNGGRRRQHGNQYHPNMVNPMNMSMHQSMYQYPPQYNNSMYMPPHAEHEYYYGQNNWVPNPQMDNMNFSYLDHSMVSTGYYPVAGHGPDVSADVASQHGEEMSHCSDQQSQVGPPPGMNFSLIGSDNCKTPSKGRNYQPQSPHWSHLNVPSCLASPGGVHPSSPQHFIADNIHGNVPVYGNGQILMNNYNNVSHAVPPSPATMFQRSGQPYLSPGNNYSAQPSIPSEVKESDASSLAMTVDSSSNNSSPGSKEGVADDATAAAKM